MAQAPPAITRGRNPVAPSPFAAPKCAAGPLSADAVPRWERTCRRNTCRGVSHASSRFTLLITLPALPITFERMGPRPGSGVTSRGWPVVRGRVFQRNHRPHVAGLKAQTGQFTESLHLLVAPDSVRPGPASSPCPLSPATPPASLHPSTPYPAHPVAGHTRSSRGQETAAPSTTALPASPAHPSTPGPSFAHDDALILCCSGAPTTLTAHVQQHRPPAMPGPRPRQGSSVAPNGKGDHGPTSAFG